MKKYGYILLALLVLGGFSINQKNTFAAYVYYEGGSGAWSDPAATTYRMADFTTGISTTTVDSSWSIQYTVVGTQSAQLGG